MENYRVQTEYECETFDTMEEAQRYFTFLKETYMAEGVVANETYVELDQQDGEDYRTIQKVIAVRDEERTELRTPREEGCDWDYWAKWQEVK